MNQMTPLISVGKVVNVSFLPVLLIRWKWYKGWECRDNPPTYTIVIG